MGNLLFYRIMNAPAVEKALGVGKILMNAGERAFGGLVGVGYKPRLSPYYFQMPVSKELLSTIKEVNGSPFKVNYFADRHSLPTSTRQVLTGINELPLSKGLLFKKVGKKYEPVLDYDKELKQLQEDLHKTYMFSLPESGALSLRPIQLFLESPFENQGYSSIVEQPYLYNGDKFFGGVDINQLKDPLLFLKGLEALLKQNGELEVSALAKTDKMLEAARQELMLHGIDPRLITKDMLEQYVQMSLNNLSSDESIIFHSTRHPYTGWDPSKIGRNTGNSGYYGRGLYFSQNPQESYGHWIQPMKLSNIDVNDVLNIGFRQDNGSHLLPYTLNPEVLLLLDKTMRKPYYWDKKTKRFYPENRYSPYPGMSEGNTDPEAYNKIASEFPVIIGAGDSKGSNIIGDYYQGIPEIVVTGGDNLSPVFEDPNLIESLNK